jgi:hypothetical protein
MLQLFDRPIGGRVESVVIAGRQVNNAMVKAILGVERQLMITFVVIPRVLAATKESIKRVRDALDLLHAAFLDRSKMQNAPIGGGNLSALFSPLSTRSIAPGTRRGGSDGHRDATIA